MKKSISQTPAPKKDRIYGSKVNAKGSAASEKSASEIKLSPTIIAALTTKLKEFREKHSNKNITLNDLKAVYRRGLGAYSTSHRPNITRNAWAMARVNKFLLKAGGTKVKAAYIQDDDLMKFDGGGATIGKPIEFYQRTYADGTTQKISIDDYEKNALPYLEKGGALYLAPNGKPSNLTPEQYKLVRTPEFKAWFGDWEKLANIKITDSGVDDSTLELLGRDVSKVVDENGEPLVVYHGTYAKEQFGVFDFDKADLGFHFGTYEQGKDRSQTRMYVEGYKSIINPYFLNVRKLVNVHDVKEWEYPQRYIDTLISEGLITEKEAKQNGFFDIYYREDNKLIREFLINKFGNIGFDYENKIETKGISYIVLEANQIKLADGTNTTFDSRNPDIRYENGGEVKSFYTWFCNWYKGVCKDIDIMISLPNAISGLKSIPYQEENAVILDMFRKKDQNIDAKPYLQTILNKADEYGITIYLLPDPNYKYIDDIQYRKKLSTKYLIDYYKDFGFELIADNEFMKREYKYAKSGDASQEITCRNCGWQWNTKDSEEYDKYVCHKCGFDNRTYYDVDPIGYKKGGQVNNCKEFILQNKAVLANGFYFNMNDLSKLFDPYGQVPTHLDFTLVSYNSDGQSNLDVIDTINPKLLVDRLSELLGLEKNQSYVVVHYVIANAKRFTNINQITTEKIVVVDIDMVVCENLNEYAGGGEVDEHKETYAKWKSLVNMSYEEIESFYNSKEGKEAGLSSNEAKEQGISSGRESARWLMKMKKTSKEDWTPTMWKWANKQISFISRMSGVKGVLYDDNGNKTRKHTSLLIWGHNPKKDSSMKYDDGGKIDYEEAIKQFRIAYPSYDDRYLTSKDRRSISMKSFYAIKRLEKTIGFDIGNLPSLTDNQKRIRQELFERLRESKEETKMADGGISDFGKASTSFDKYEISDYWDIEQFGGGGEVKTKKIITDKIGWNEEIADYFIEQNPKLALWFADSIMKREIKRSYGGSFFDEEGTFGGGYVKIDNDKVARIVVNKFFTTKLKISSNYGGSIRRILDWLQHPLAEKQNLRELSYDEAIQKEEQFHEELVAIGGDIDFVEPEENEIFIKYPKDKDGAEFYWVKIPSNFCSLESSRMGHCGRTGDGNILISLRSIRPYGKGHTINDSHVTIAYNEKEGIFYQTKGKKNQKPAQKYNSYIFDLIKTLATTDRYKDIKGLEEQENILKQKDNDIYKKLERYGYLPNMSSSEILEYKKGNPKFSQEYQDLNSEKYRLEEKLNEVKNNRDFNAINDRIDEIENEKANISRTIIDLLKEKGLNNSYITDIEVKLIDLKYSSQYAFNGFGSEYASNEDYGFDDMSKEQIQELYELNPKIFEDFGGQITLYENGIIKEEPNSKFTLSKQARYVEDLLNGASNYRDGLIENILLGDTDSLYDYESYSQDDIMRNYFSDINKENIDAIEEKIAEITNISIEEVKENGAEYYLSGDYRDDIDEEYDFDIIFNTISRAIDEATASDYYSYLYKQLKNSLEELGDVKKLDDEGVEIEIDLSNLLTSSQISSYYKEVAGNLQDIFFEAESNGDIDLPKFDIDDRYSPYAPYAEKKPFNEYLSYAEYYEHGGILEYVLWGTKIGEPNGYESVLYVSDEPIVINQKLIDVAKSKGYDRLRVFSNNMNEKPNFIKAIKKEYGGEIINKNITFMEKNKFDSLPSIDSVNIGDGLILYEEVFTGDLENPRHIGRRYIVCEAIDIDNRTNFLNLRVLNSVGVNPITVGSKISRPVSVVFARGKKYSMNGKEMNNFKNGGELNPDNKVVKEFFAHDSGNAGGVLVGKRHSEGGIKAINKSTGQPLEMEGGEVVLTRGAVSNPKKYLFEGKEMTTREISSKLNVDGGGVSFAEGGDVEEKNDCGC